MPRLGSGDNAARRGYHRFCERPISQRCDGAHHSALRGEMQQQASDTRPSADPGARILAVFALVAAAIVVIVVIAGSVGGSGGSSGKEGRAGTGRERQQSKYYVVQPGDTFGAIAEKEGISVTRLEALNPNLDTQLLPQKGCVNLVPEGCKVLAKGG